MRSNIHGLRLRMVAEIDRHPSWPILAAKQESDRRGTRRAVRQGFYDGASYRRGSKLIQQVEKLGGLSAGRLALSKGQIEQHLALRYHLLQTATRRRVKGSAFGFQHGVPMVGIEHLLLT